MCERSSLDDRGAARAPAPPGQLSIPSHARPPAGGTASRRRGPARGLRHSCVRVERNGEGTPPDLPHARGTHLVAPLQDEVVLVLDAVVAVDELLDAVLSNCATGGGVGRMAESRADEKETLATCWRRAGAVPARLVPAAREAWHVPEESGAAAARAQAAAAGASAGRRDATFARARGTWTVLHPPPRARASAPRPQSHAPYAAHCSESAHGSGVPASRKPISRERVAKNCALFRGRFYNFSCLQ